MLACSRDRKLVLHSVHLHDPSGQRHISMSISLHSDPLSSAGGDNHCPPVDGVFIFSALVQLGESCVQPVQMCPVSRFIKFVQRNGWRFPSGVSPHSTGIANSLQYSHCNWLLRKVAGQLSEDDEKHWKNSIGIVAKESRGMSKAGWSLSS